MKPDYCTQNNGDCPSCSLVNYGRDCLNHRIFTLGDLAAELTGGDLRGAARLLNDSGMVPRIDELQPDPGAFIPRPAMVAMAATRAGDRIGRKTAELLR